MSDNKRTYEPIIGGETRRSSMNLPGVSPPHRSLDWRPEVSLDTVFTLLSDQRCRHILTHLTSVTDGVVDLTELVAAVAVREPRENSGDDQPYEAVELAVRHIHLPKLEEVGILEYDAQSRTIRYYGHPQLEAYLVLANTCEMESDANPVRQAD